MLPSTPTAKPKGLFPLIGKCVITPAGVMRPIRSVSLNHRLPSGPTTMLVGARSGPEPPSGNSVTCPAVVILAMAEPGPADSTIHRLWSGPVTIPFGELLDCPALRASSPGGGSENSVTWPDGVIRPTFPTASSVNQMLPSGPQVMPSGSTAPSRGNLVTTPCGVIFRIKSGLRELLAACD